MEQLNGVLAGNEDMKRLDEAQVLAALDEREAEADGVELEQGYYAC